MIISQEIFSESFSNTKRDPAAQSLLTLCQYTIKQFFKWNSEVGRLRRAGEIYEKQ